MFPFYRRYHILALSCYFRISWVVFLHVTAAAAAGCIDACFDGWGRKAAFGDIVDRWADVACPFVLEENGVVRKRGRWTRSTTAVGGFGCLFGDELLCHVFSKSKVVALQGTKILKEITEFVQGDVD